MTEDTLEQALVALGELLQDRSLSYDIVVIGGGALVLTGQITRATEDLDAVARVEGDRWKAARPLPDELRSAVDQVGEAYNLPTSKDDKAWLNDGPSMLFDFGLPAGFIGRVEIRRFGSLTVRFASRYDQIHLKLYAATAPDRTRKKVDIQDLKDLRPEDAELRDAAMWCAKLDGRLDFIELDVLPVLKILGKEGAL